MQKLLEEVISHVGNLGGMDMEIRLEVTAHASSGIPQDVVRTVSENCSTLKVDDFDFTRGE